MTWGTFNKKDSLAESIAKKLSPITEGKVETKKYSWGTMKHVEHGHSFSIPLHPEHHQAIHKLKDGESHSFTDETKSKWKATREGDKVHFHGASRGNDGYKTTVKHDDLKESAEQELDALINEVLTADHPAGKWIEDFVKSDNPKFAGKSKEKRKQMALAAYYAAQKKESTDYESFVELDEEKDLIKRASQPSGKDSKAIKHDNVKEKQNDQETMEPRNGSEEKFVNAAGTDCKDDPTQRKFDSGTGKVTTATKPSGKGPASWNAKEKLGKQGIKEEAGDEISDEEVTIEEAASCSDKKASSKKSFSDFKKAMK